MNFIINTFTTHQFGFLPGRSAPQQLILYTDELFYGKIKSTGVDVIYCTWTSKKHLTQYPTMLCYLSFKDLVLQVTFKVGLQWPPT